jgi:hypothetical protein
MPPCYVPMCRTLGISPTVLDRNDVRRDAFIALPDMIAKGRGLPIVPRPFAYPLCAPNYRQVEANG